MSNHQVFQVDLSEKKDKNVIAKLCKLSSFWKFSFSVPFPKFFEVSIWTKDCCIRLRMNKISKNVVCGQKDPVRLLETKLSTESPVTLSWRFKKKRKENSTSFKCFWTQRFTEQVFLRVFFRNESERTFVSFSLKRKLRFWFTVLCLLSRVWMTCEDLVEVRNYVLRKWFCSPGGHKRRTWIEDKPLICNPTENSWYVWMFRMQADW